MTAKFSQPSKYTNTATFWLILKGEIGFACYKSFHFLLISIFCYLYFFMLISCMLSFVFCNFDIILTKCWVAKIFFLRYFLAFNTRSEFGQRLLLRQNQFTTAKGFEKRKEEFGRPNGLLLSNAVFLLLLLERITYTKISFNGVTI